MRSFLILWGSPTYYLAGGDGKAGFLLGRSSRAEVHIPLFYPVDDAELRTMISVLAKKSGTSVADGDLPTEIAHKGNLSGADIEGIVGRAFRTSLLNGSR